MDSLKRFKDSLSLEAVNSNLQDLISDLGSFKSTATNDMNDIKTGIQLLTCSVNTTHQALREEMATAFTKLTDAMAGLASQVNDLKEENKEKNLRLQKMENKVNVLEQQLLNRNVEIKNVHNDQLTAVDVIKTIAASVNVEIQERDISNAYKLKKSNKIIVEFCSLNKKRDLMSNIRGHRVKGDIFHNNMSTDQETSKTTNDNSSYNVFVNDELTAHNRKLLWMAKTKAKESGWKFVWYRNGHLLAKKNENSAAILISNSSDIELIC